MVKLCWTPSDRACAVTLNESLSSWLIKMRGAPVAVLKVQSVSPESDFAVAGPPKAALICVGVNAPQIAPVPADGTAPEAGSVGERDPGPAEFTGAEPLGSPDGKPEESPLGRLEGSPLGSADGCVDPLG